MQSTETWLVLWCVGSSGKHSSLRTFARNFCSIDFFFGENFSIERWRVGDVRNVKKKKIEGSPTSFWKGHARKNIYNGVNRDSPVKMATVAASPKILQLEFSVKHGLNGPIKRTKSAGEVPERTSSHLATTISRALLLQDGRIPCLADRNSEFFSFPHWCFVHFWTMWR